MQSHQNILDRFGNLTTILDGFDPWYDLDYDQELDDLEREFAELRLELPAR
jgi:hypothetical protein